MLPTDGVVFGLEGVFGHMRVIGQDLGVKVTPDQFTQPGAGACHALQMHAIGDMGQLSDADRAKAQMDAEVTGASDGRKVTRLLVMFNPVQEVFKQGLRAAAASLDLQIAQIAGLKAQIAQAWNGALPLTGQGCQGISVLLDRVGL